MINAIFGKSFTKTMENVRKYTVVKFVQKWNGIYGAKSLISQLNFHSLSIFDENFIAIQMNKTKITFNKPIFIGQAVLDISKTILYDFHYDYMVPTFNNNLKILYIDTDSLTYNIRDKDFYLNLRKVCKDHFDTSNYFFFKCKSRTFILN